MFLEPCSSVSKVYFKNCYIVMEFLDERLLDFLAVHIMHFCCTLGWSDLALFYDFRKATRFCWSGILFRRSIPKNRQILPRARASHARQSFNFKKIAGALIKYEFFVWKFAESFLIHQRTIANKKIWNIKLLIFFLNNASLTTHTHTNHTTTYSVNIIYMWMNEHTTCK